MNDAENLSFHKDEILIALNKNKEILRFTKNERNKREIIPSSCVESVIDKKKCLTNFNCQN